MKKTKMLKKNYEFRRILSKGVCFSEKNISAFIQKSKEQSCNFLGLAISSKVGKAVRRNHIKRLIRESYYYYELQITNGNNIVFVWNKNIDSQNVQFQDIKKDVEKIFKRAKIFIRQ